MERLHWRMEAGCALIGAVALGAMPNPGGVGWALLGWMLLTLAILDWRHFWLPDALTLPLAFLGLTIGLWSTDVALIDRIIGARSEEQTSELQSLMRISYAVFCLKKKKSI